MSKINANAVSSTPFTLNNYFEFKAWDQQDLTAFTFYDCVILHSFGPFEKGQTVDTIDVDFNSGRIEVSEITSDTTRKVLFCGYIVMNIVKRDVKDIPKDDEYSTYVRD